MSQDVFEPTNLFRHGKAVGDKKYLSNSDMCVETGSALLPLLDLGVDPGLHPVKTGRKYLFGPNETFQKLVLSILKALIQTGHSFLNQSPNHVII